MKIEVSESTLKIIICSLKTYLNKCLDIDEDAPEMVVVAKALGELQGAFRALKDIETEKEKHYESFRLYRVSSELKEQTQWYRDWNKQRIRMFWPEH